MLWMRSAETFLARLWCPYSFSAGFPGNIRRNPSTWPDRATQPRPESTHDVSGMPCAPYFLSGSSKGRKWDVSSQGLGHPVAQGLPGDIVRGPVTIGMNPVGEKEEKRV